MTNAMETEAAPATGWYARLVESYGTQERCLMGMSIFRIVAGLAILIQYLVNYANRHYLFGPDGVYPWSAFVKGIEGSRHFSIYSFSADPVYFEVLFHLGIVIGVLWVLGWRTRILTPLHFVFWWSLEHRFPGIWDGGDNIFRIVVIFACFADVSGHFSLDARRRKPAPRGELRAGAMLHNTAVLAMACQLCLLYGVAGLSKVQGETWRDGTALYYALRGGQYTWPGFSEFIYQNVYLVVLFSYVTVAFQVSFTFLLFLGKRTRQLAICMSLAFHVGIMLFMGLISFSMFMMAVDLALLTDDEYTGAAGWLSERGRRARALWARWAAPRATAPQAVARVSAEGAPGAATEAEHAPR